MRREGISFGRGKRSLLVRVPRRPVPAKRYIWKLSPSILSENDPDQRTLEGGLQAMSNIQLGSRTAAAACVYLELLIGITIYGLDVENLRRGQLGESGNIHSEENSVPNVAWRNNNKEGGMNRRGERLAERGMSVFKRGGVPREGFRDAQETVSEKGSIRFALEEGELPITCSG